MVLSVAATEPTSPLRRLLVLSETHLSVTASGLMVLAAGVGAWGLGHKFGGRAAYSIAYCSVLVLAASVVMARRARPLEASRSSVAGRTRVGQTLQVRFTLSARRRVAAFVIEEQIPASLGMGVRFLVSEVSAALPIERVYQLAPTVRGVFEIGPLTAEYSDPLGLSKRRVVLADPVKIIVHPHLDEVSERPLTRAFEEPPVRPPNSRAWPDGFEFYGLREYVRGDDVRRVVWRAFARTGKLLVREFEQGINDQIVIVLDTMSSSHSPGSPSDTFEAAVRTAASVGVRHVKDGFTVQLEVNSHKVGVFRGPGGRMALLDALAEVQLGDEPLAAALRRTVKTARRDSHVVIITSDLDDASANSASLLTSRGGSLTLVAVNWEEMGVMTIPRGRKIGAQIVQVRPEASLRAAFSASLRMKPRAHL